VDHQDLPVPEEKKRSYDPIPEKGLLLSETFERVYEALKANPEVFQTLDSALRKYLVKNGELEDQRDKRKSGSPQGLAALHRRKEAVVFFRSALGRGDLTAHIRDPQDGAVLQLAATDWAPVGGRLLLLEPPYTFEDDFLDNAPFSGNPNTCIRGAYRPVFLWRNELEHWLAKTFLPKNSGGRPLGSGSYEVADEPFMEKMHNLIKSGDAKSANEAAGRFAPEAKGASFESKQDRLRRRYLKRYSSE
jgi:hypothetical protein